MLAWLRLACVVLTLAAPLAPASDPLVAQGGPALPERLTDRELWQIVTSLSEPAGSYPSENLVSNEIDFQAIFPTLLDRHPPGGVYLGVGPEQNFTYIANLRPSVALIIDIRRGNRDLHLMYRALFELAPDRADFVSLLFSIPRPSGLTTASSAADIFAAFARMKRSEADYRANLDRVKALLTRTRGWPLSGDDLRGIESVYESFYAYGITISYDSGQGAGTPNLAALLKPPSGGYASLMRATDARGEPRSYLSSEDRFRIVRDLQMKNLIVPLVGDFAGPKTLRALGDWLRARRAAVSTFYVSNVEDYLRSSGRLPAFCLNVAALPTDDRSELISTSTPGAPRPTVGRPRAVAIGELTAGCPPRR
jgi:hypothetical protein